MKTDYKKIFFFISATLLFAGFFSLRAQELVADTILMQAEQPVLLLPDSLKSSLSLPSPTDWLDNQDLRQDFRMKLDKQLLKDKDRQMQDLPVKLELEQEKDENQWFISRRFQPGAAFTLNASRWYLPVLGAVTTFSPGLSYQFSENFSLYGGVSFSQIHYLAYIQNRVNPSLPAKSNLLADGYLGATYTLWDRVILRGGYQRSLYNQLPVNMMMMAPGQNMVSVGASLDIWHGLGVTVEHVWQFDDYGRMKKGMRYSPYVDINKFVKFLRGY